MAHGDAREGKWKGNWRMQWVASTVHTTSERGVSSITTADAHTSAASNRLNWRPPADLNGLVRFAKRRNLVSARVLPHFNWPLPPPTSFTVSTPYYSSRSSRHICSSAGITHVGAPQMLQSKCLRTATNAVHRQKDNVRRFGHSVLCRPHQISNRDILLDVGWCGEPLTATVWHISTLTEGWPRSTKRPKGDRYRRTGRCYRHYNKCCAPVLLFSTLPVLFRDRGGTVVKVLCYKSEGHWFDPSSLK